MNRRKFLRNTVPATVVLPGLINGFSFSALGASPGDSMSSLLASASNDHILVLIQLNGGNDGINMVVPLDMYANYYNARTNVAIPQSKVLRLDGVDKSGLHPAMTDFQNLYNDGKASLVQSVGYANQDFSHFRSTDIWMTGDITRSRFSREKTGWLGRYLENEYPGYPDAYPNSETPHPLAIQIADMPSVTVQGPILSMGLSIKDPEDVYTFSNPFSDYPLTATAANKELRYLRVISEKTKTYSDIIRAAYNQGSNLGTYQDNDLAQQLRIVARLIKGGLKTRVYTVSVSGFDTHKKQVNPSDTTTGRHASLMSELSSSMASFQKDLELLKEDHRVLGMTFSEFGRRIQSNASLGTDHGAAAPLIMFGKHVNKGVLGKSPDIPADIKKVNNIPFQYDFRSVYATVLERWFCVKEPLIDTLLLKHYQSLPLIKGGPCGLPDTIEENNAEAEKMILKMSPVPYGISATIQFSTAGGFTSVQQINALGQVVKVITAQDYAAGTYNLDVYDDKLLAGVYFLRLQNKSLQKVITILKGIQ
ncbi:MAG: DUF1501 domain-containing protein [Chitinophagaceae bacterium]|nr:DUF1501 domain-containing protein [Chitinophagaceae bacterium]